MCGPTRKTTYGEIHLGEALLSFTRNLGFRKKDLAHLIEEVLVLTEDYGDRIEALTTLPGSNKKNLIAIVDDVKKELRNIKR